MNRYNIPLGNYYLPVLDYSELTEYPRTYEMDLLEYVEQYLYYDPANVYTREIWKHGKIANDRNWFVSEFIEPAELAYTHVMDVDTSADVDKELWMSKPSVGFADLMIAAYQFEWLNYDNVIDAVHQDFDISGMQMNSKAAKILLYNRTYPYNFDTDYGKLMNSNFIESGFDDVKVVAVKVVDVSASTDFITRYKVVLEYKADYLHWKFITGPVVFDSKKCFMSNICTELKFELPELAVMTDEIFYRRYAWTTQEFDYYDDINYRPVYKEVSHELIMPLYIGYPRADVFVDMDTDFVGPFVVSNLCAKSLMEVSETIMDDAIPDWYEPREEIIFSSEGLIVSNLCKTSLIALPELATITDYTIPDWYEPREKILFSAEGLIVSNLCEESLMELPELADVSTNVIYNHYEFDVDEITYDEDGNEIGTVTKHCILILSNGEIISSTKTEIE